MKPLNPDIVPSTIKQAVDILFDMLEPDDIKYINGREDPHAISHFSLGRFLRNNWGMWETESPLKNDAIQTYKIAHADDISGLILSWVFALAKGEQFDYNEHCKVYHKHWAKFDMTSIEAGIPK